MVCYGISGVVATSTSSPDPRFFLLEKLWGRVCYNFSGQKFAFATEYRKSSIKLPGGLISFKHFWGGGGGGLIERGGLKREGGLN